MNMGRKRRVARGLGISRARKMMGSGLTDDEFRELVYRTLKTPIERDLEDLERVLTDEGELSQEEEADRGEEEFIEEWEEWWMEAEPLSSPLPVDIERVRMLTPAEAFGFLELAIGEGTWYFAAQTAPDGWRLTPRLRIDMSEKEHVTAWAEKLGVTARDPKKDKAVVEVVNGRAVTFKRPVYAFWKCGARLLKVLYLALTNPFAYHLIETFPKLKIMVELGSFVVPPEKDVKRYYSLIKPKDIERLYELREQAIRIIPIPSRITRTLTNEERTEIVKLREYGANVKEISEALNIDPPTIYKVLERTKRFTATTQPLLV